MVVHFGYSGTLIIRVDQKLAENFQIVRFLNEIVFFYYGFLDFLDNSRQRRPGKFRRQCLQYLCSHIKEVKISQQNILNARLLNFDNDIFTGDQAGSMYLSYGGRSESNGINFRINLIQRPLQFIFDNLLDYTEG